MSISNLLTGKTARFIVITVVLGAIGSGVWEWMLKPALSSLSEFGLNIATLGIKSFKDSLYKQIALGFHEESSVRVYIAIYSLVPSFLLGILAGWLSSVRRIKTLSETSNSTKWQEKLYRPFLIVITFALVFCILQANQMSYINRAITHFHVLLQIVSPYINEDQRLIYQSQFAQISTKDDYAKLVNELTATCNTKKLKAPKFSTW